MSPRETAAEVTCTRCQGIRWLPVPYIPLSARGLATGPPRDLREPDGYLCQRCTRVLAGYAAVRDPVASEAQVAACQAAQRASRIATTGSGNDPRSDAVGREDSSDGPR